MEVKKYYENPHSFHVKTKGNTIPLKPFAKEQEAIAFGGEYSKQL